MMTYEEIVENLETNLENDERIFAMLNEDTIDDNYDMVVKIITTHNLILKDLKAINEKLKDEKLINIYNQIEVNVKKYKKIIINNIKI